MRQLSCKGLTLEFGNVRALDNVDLSFPLSGVVALIGPNGSGKTTLINAISGFERRYSGSIYFALLCLDQLSVRERVRLGIVRTFQSPRLMRSRSLIDNILVAFPRQRGEGMINALLSYGISQNELTNRAAAISLLNSVGLATRAEQSARSLSFGEEKMLTLSAIRASGGSTFLLDEPLAGVDIVAREKAEAILRKIADEGHLVIFVEHDLASVERIADVTILLSRGRVVDIGATATVLDNASLVRSFSV